MNVVVKFQDSIEAGNFLVTLTVSFSRVTLVHRISSLQPISLQ
jgi:hypothetical protein